MSLELECVGRCVSAVRALIRSLSSVATNVSLQLAQLDTRVITFRTLVRLFVCMSVTRVSHQLTGSRERRVAELAEMRFRACVSVDVIGQAGDGFEATLANVTLVRAKIVHELTGSVQEDLIFHSPIFRVALHVPCEQIPLWRHVVTVGAHMNVVALRRSLPPSFLDRCFAENLHNL